MISEYDKVRIIETGIIGRVIDIHTTDDVEVYIVESEKKGVPGGYGGEDSWKLFDCTQEELEKID